MAFLKVVKGKAYYKRYQTKYRRRRENKTDYAQRRALVKQDKNKYNTPKYRLAVRTTNTRVLCQIIYATIEGDRVLCQADSMELKRYGCPVGLKNYAAAYATGLLCARRMLKQIGLDSNFAGVAEADGEEYYVADEETERRPFKCILDVGLVRTTIGNRVFGAMKGAADGGLDIPHNNKRFPGFSPPDDPKGKKDGEYDAESHRDRIFGCHVAEYMKQMKEDEPEEYERHFSSFIKAGITSEKVESMYESCHAAIRASPEAAAKAEKEVKNVRKGHSIVTPSGKTYTRQFRLNNKQRKERVMQKIRNAQAKMAAAMEAEDDE